MSVKSCGSRVLPTRAEFIRDVLAEWCDGLGYTVEQADDESEFEHPTLYVSSARQDLSLYVTTAGEIFDIDTGKRMRLPGFTWCAESTDTGAMHGLCVECRGAGILNPGEPDCDFPYGTPAAECPWCDGAGVQETPATTRTV